MSEKTNKNTLQFKFDVSAYRLLGRELITDRITALFELVKNSYDANAENVLVQFDEINPRSATSKIIIQDDGIGMTFEDIRDKWMVIGTSSKRKSRQSPAPYYRNVVGKKGVGRFAVDKLGAKLILKSKQKHSNQVVCLETDWSFYADMEVNQLKIDFDGEQQFFTDIKNHYWFEELNDNSHGTTLEISMVNDVWSEKDIERASKELSKLLSPAHKSKYPFRIKIDANQYEKYKNKTIESIVIDHATLHFNLGFDEATNQQEILQLDKGKLNKILVPIRPCGLIGMTIYYFDQKAKNAYKSSSSDLIDGIKVYRDDLIATPFAEYAQSQNEQKDLFGIDKRRYSGFFEKLSTRDLLGWVDISDKRNPDIIDATNRQDFVDNDAWKEMKDFVIEQITVIEKYIKSTKDLEKNQTKSEFKIASTNLSEIRKEINKLKLETDSPQAQKKLESISSEIAKAQATVNRSLKDYQELEKEKKQQENLFFSLVSLQTYAGMLSHITRTSIGKVKRGAEFIRKWIPAPQYNEDYKIQSDRIFNEMNRLENAVDFMLKYARDDQQFEEINLKEAIEYLFNDIYNQVFNEKNIKGLVEINKDLFFNYNKKAFDDIFDNLISNSFKALKNKDGERIISCKGIVEKNELVILFSDNGCGIEEKDKYRIFDVFVTTTAEEGGAGLGLFIVKSRLEALHGTIEVIENEYKPTGATFKITLPFKK